MSYNSEAEVIGEADALLRETQTLRDEAARYEKVHGMYLLPKLPKDLARDEAVYILSPDVIHEVRETKAKIMTFDIEIQCIPTVKTAAGTVAGPVQRQVDQLEQAAAIFLAKLDPDQVIKGYVIDRVLVEPLAITILEMGAIDSPDPAERFCWKWFDVDLDGCGWLEVKGVPTLFARHYSEYVFTTEHLYSGRKDGVRPGDNLRIENGKAQWRQASEDQGKTRGQFANDQTGLFEKCEKVWLDDGEEIIHVVLNSREYNRARFNVGPFGVGRSQDRTGEIVWRGPNPFGRVSAFLTGSNVRPARLMQDRYLPYYLDLITTTEQENVIQSVRATAARNRAAPRDYWHADPEVIKAVLAANGGQMPPPTEWADGRTPIGYGELKERPVSIDPDTDKLDQRMQERKSRYSGASTLRDPDVLQKATAAAILAGYDAENASLSIVVGPQDTLRRQLLEAWEHSVGWLAKHYPAYAKFKFMADGSGYEPSLSGGKRMTGGEEVEITADSFDVGHKWYVLSAQKTRGQTEAAFTAAVERFVPLPDGRPNIGIYDDLFQAANISNINERKVTLAKEAVMHEAIDDYIVQLAKASVDHEIELDSGIRPQLLPPASGNGFTPPAPPPGGGEPPNTGLTVNSPATQPVEGGGQPEFIAG